MFTASTRWPKYDMPILYSCHPRSASAWRPPASSSTARAHAPSPWSFHDYNCLQMNAFAVVSDSGTLPEESSFFASVGRPFPAVCIRTSTERPEALDKACFTLAGISERGLLQAVHTAIELDAEGRCRGPVPDYADETVSTRWSRSSRATPASWTRWCGGRIFKPHFY
ncbi:MAG: UDP-N-acetylglucosamine 2-epimerase [Collinsella sp.]